MLTKNCKTILKFVISLPPQERFVSHQLQHLAEKTQLSYDEVLSACKELDRDGMAELKIIHLRSGHELPASITPTERGLNYKAILRAQRLAYLADKWVDILASAVAVCSLIVSIIALLRTQ